MLVPDAIFADPRLAPIYDAFDGDRADLDIYLDLVEALEAQHVVDVGCGTGSLAVLLAQRGLTVTGVDPAEASLQVARSKPSAASVRWICGDALDLPPLGADLAVMTGNVAQVFLTGAEWNGTLRSIRAALRDGGHLVFETRRPERCAWVDWDTQRLVRDVPGVGEVEQRTTVTEVALPLVSFRHTYTFRADGSEVTSDSTLRFRTRREVEESLSANGFTTREIGDAPDRPGQEYVFLAQRT